MIDEKEKIEEEQKESKYEFEHNLDEAREKEYLRKLEAALFLAGRWMTLQDLVMLTNINPILLKILISKLKERFGEDNAIQILEREDMWKMDIKQEYHVMVNKLATGSSEFTKAEQSTLAIIAYKQPLKQSVVVKIRGNKAYEHVKKFAQLNLIKAKRVGHTKELSLSDEFYNYFSLQPDEIEEGEVGKLEVIENKSQENS